MVVLWFVKQAKGSKDSYRLLSKPEIAPCQNGFATFQQFVSIKGLDRPTSLDLGSLPLVFCQSELGKKGLFFRKTQLTTF